MSSDQLDDLFDQASGNTGSVDQLDSLFDQASGDQLDNLFAKASGDYWSPKMENNPAAPDKSFDLTNTDSDFTAGLKGLGHGLLETVVAPTTRALGTAGLGTLGAAGGIMQGMGENYGLVHLADFGAEVSKEVQDTQAARQKAHGYVSPGAQFMEDVSSSLMMSIPLVASSELGGLGVMGAISGGNEYSQARQRGASPKIAGTSAMWNMATEIASEGMIGAVPATKRLAKMIEGEMGAAQAVIGSTFGEGLEEAVTGIAQTLGSEFLYKDDYYWTPEQKMQRAQQTMVERHVDLGTAIDIVEKKQMEQLWSDVKQVAYQTATGAAGGFAPAAGLGLLLRNQTSPPPVPTPAEEEIRTSLGSDGLKGITAEYANQIRKNRDDAYVEDRAASGAAVIDIIQGKQEPSELAETDQPIPKLFSDGVDIEQEMIGAIQEKATSFNDAMDMVNDLWAAAQVAEAASTTKSEALTAKKMTGQLSKAKTNFLNETKVAGEPEVAKDLFESGRQAAQQAHDEVPANSKFLTPHKDVALGAVLATDAVETSRQMDPAAVAAARIIDDAKDSLNATVKDTLLNRIAERVDAATQRESVLAKLAGAENYAGLLNMSEDKLILLPEQLLAEVEKARIARDEIRRQLENMPDPVRREDIPSAVARMRTAARQLEEAGLAPKGHFDSIDSWVRREGSTTARPDVEVHRDKGGIPQVVVPRYAEDAVSEYRDAVANIVYRSAKRWGQRYREGLRQLVSRGRSPIGNMSQEEYVKSKTEKLRLQLQAMYDKVARTETDPKKLVGKLDQLTDRLLSKYKIPKEDVVFRGDLFEIEGDVLNDSRNWIQAATQGQGISKMTPPQLLELSDMAFSGHAPKYVHDLILKEAESRTPVGQIVTPVVKKLHEITKKKFGRHAPILMDMLVRRAESLGMSLDDYVKSRISDVDTTESADKEKDALYQLAFHASMNLFDKFDMSKALSGAGDHWFTRGAYFFTNHKVGKYYVRMFSTRPTYRYVFPGIDFLSVTETGKDGLSNTLRDLKEILFSKHGIRPESSISEFSKMSNDIARGEYGDNIELAAKGFAENMPTYAKEDGNFSRQDLAKDVADIFSKNNFSIEKEQGNPAYVYTVDVGLKPNQILDLDQNIMSQISLPDFIKADLAEYKVHVANNVAQAKAKEKLAREKMSHSATSLAIFFGKHGLTSKDTFESVESRLGKPIAQEYDDLLYGNNVDYSLYKEAVDFRADQERLLEHKKIGEFVYKDVIGKVGTKLSELTASEHKEAQRILSGYGIRGARYLDAGSRGDINHLTSQKVDPRHRTWNIVSWFPESDVKIVGVKPIFSGPKILLQSEEGSAKGSVRFASDGKAVIGLYEHADASTFIHEWAHIFRREVSGEDLKTIEDWAGVRDGKWTREAEEHWARGFERWLAEGGEEPTAPSGDGFFTKIKNAMIEVYKQIVGTDIDVNVSPAVREVMGRLLAPGSTTPEAEMVGERTASAMNFLKQQSKDLKPETPPSLVKSVRDKLGRWRSPLTFDAAGAVSRVRSSKTRSALRSALVEGSEEALNAASSINFKASQAHDAYQKAIASWVKAARAAGVVVSTAELQQKMKEASISGDPSKLGDPRLEEILTTILIPAKNEIQNQAKTLTKDPNQIRLINDSFNDYMHRSYSIFKDRNAAMKPIDKTTALYKDFKEIIHSRYAKAFEEQAKIIHGQRSVEAGYTKEQADAMIEKEVDAQVDQTIRTLYFSIVGNEGLPIAAKLPKEKLDYLKKRTLQDPAVRKILGEIVDPAEAMLEFSKKVASDVGKKLMRKRVLDAFSVVGQIRPQFGESAIGNETYVPIEFDGETYNATPEVARLWNSMDVHEQRWQAVSQVISAVKLGLILNPANAVGQFLSAIMQVSSAVGPVGLFTHLKMVPVLMQAAKELTNVGSAGADNSWLQSDTAEKIYHMFGMKNRDEVLKLAEDLIAHGVHSAGEYGRSVQNDAANISSGFDRGGNAAAVVGWLGDKYQIIRRADILASAIVYKALLPEFSIKLGLPETDSRVAAEATKYMKEMTQNPETTPYAIRKLSQFPVTMGFQGFIYQVQRNASYAAYRGGKDIITGAKFMASGDPEMIKKGAVYIGFGANRLVGTYLGVFTMIELLRVAISQGQPPSDDDDEKNKKFIGIRMLDALWKAMKNPSYWDTARHLMHQNERNSRLIPGQMQMPWHEGKNEIERKDGKVMLNYTALNSLDMNQPVVSVAFAATDLFRTIGSGNWDAVETDVMNLANEMVGPYVQLSALGQAVEELAGYSVKNRFPFVNTSEPRFGIEKEHSFLTAGSMNMTGEGVYRAARRVTPTVGRWMWDSLRGVDIVPALDYREELQNAPEDALPNMVTRGLTTLRYVSMDAQQTLNRRHSETYQEYKAWLDNQKSRWKDATDDFNEQAKIRSEGKAKFNEMMRRLNEFPEILMEKGVSYGEIEDFMTGEGWSYDTKSKQAKSALPVPIRDAIMYGDKYFSWDDYLDTLEQDEQ